MYTTAFLCPHLLHSRYVSMPSQFQCLCKPYILFSFVFSILFVLKVPSRTADIKPDRDELVAQEGGVVCIHVHVCMYTCIPVHGSSFFFGKVTALGVLCCFALFVFLLISHLKTCTCMYMYIIIYNCLSIQVMFVDNTVW